MPIPLEDTSADVLGKAQRGLKLSETDVTSRSGLTPEEWQSLLDGKSDPALFAKVAPVLNLNAEALSGHASYQPAPVDLPDLVAFNTPFDDMTVNSYLVWDPETKEAIAFDTGTDADLLLEAVRTHGLRLTALLLTHTHGDHIIELDRICEKAAIPAYVSANEPPLDGAEPFPPGKTFSCGRLRISTRATPGHSPGGITYLVEGLGRPVAIVGDAVFAGSMGGAPLAWNDALATNRREILSLPADTVLCPGHGPLTTVGEELQHNPFYAA